MEQAMTTGPTDGLVAGSVAALAIITVYGTAVWWCVLEAFCERTVSGGYRRRAKKTRTVPALLGAAATATVGVLSFWVLP